MTDWGPPTALAVLDDGAGARDVADNGYIVGSGQIFPSVSYPMLWTDPATAIQLPFGLVGDDNSTVWGINPAGTLGAGWTGRFSPSRLNAAVWDLDTLTVTVLTPRVPGERTQALGVNDNGEIVGTGEGLGTDYALYWPDASSSPTVLWSGAGSAAYDINAVGHIVGRIVNGAKYYDGSVHALSAGSLASPQAFHLNDDDVIVGHADHASGDFSTMPVYWATYASSPTELTILDAHDFGFNEAWDINNLGEISGDVDDADYTTLAAAWQSDGTLVLLDQYPSTTGGGGSGINNNSWIVGSSGSVAVLWRPAGGMVHGWGVPILQT